MTTLVSILRGLADFIETTDYDTPDKYGESGVQFALDKDGVSFHMSYMLDDAEHKKAVRKVMRAIGGNWEKTYSGTSMWFTQEGVEKFGGGNITIFAKRDAVCERKVIGTEVIEHEAREAFTETREIIEWDCGSLLAATEAVAA